MTPASRPPARLVRRRSAPSGPFSISSWAREPGAARGLDRRAELHGLDGRHREQRLADAPVELAVPRRRRCRGPAGRPRAPTRIEPPSVSPVALRGVHGRHHLRLERRVDGAQRRVLAHLLERRERARRSVVDDGAQRRGRRFAPRSRTPEEAACRRRRRPRAPPTRAPTRAPARRAGPTAPYFIPPARSAWPGRGRVRRFPAAAAGSTASGPMTASQLAKSRLRMPIAMGEPSVRPAAHARPRRRRRRSRSSCGRRARSRAAGARARGPRRPDRWSGPPACPRGSRSGAGRGTRRRSSDAEAPGESTRGARPLSRRRAASDPVPPIGAGPGGRPSTKRSGPSPAARRSGSARPRSGSWRAARRRRAWTSAQILRRGRRIAASSVGCASVAAWSARRLSIAGLDLRLDLVGVRPAGWRGSRVCWASVRPSWRAVRRYMRGAPPSGPDHGGPRGRLRGKDAGQRRFRRRSESNGESCRCSSKSSCSPLRKTSGNAPRMTPGS